jgi:DNA (cytosine-5)-methyltransferase 1
MPNHASTSMCHPDEVRALSVGECGRIQGFPDGWEFTGTVQEQMTQVGNAVPTRLGEVAGEVLAAADVEARAAVEAPAFRRVYLKSHVRTRQWFKQGTVFVWDGIGGSAHYGAQPQTRAA